MRSITNLLGVNISASGPYCNAYVARACFYEDGSSMTVRQMMEDKERSGGGGGDNLAVYAAIGALVVFRRGR